jgi:GNAT superfamily N-acetyltransferase
MKFSIRDAELPDMDDLQRVFRRASLSNANDRELLREHPEWLVLSSEAVRDRRLRVAVDGDGTTIGFSSFHIVDGVAELEDLFVDPPSMRHGVGMALVEDVVAQVRRLEFATLEVTANPHAMAFYRRLGFVELRTVDTSGYPAPRMGRPVGPLD